MSDNPVSILYKSIAGCYRPVRVADGPITAHYRFIKNTRWDKDKSQVTAILSFLQMDTWNSMSNEDNSWVTAVMSLLSSGHLQLHA